MRYTKQRSYSLVRLLLVSILLLGLGAVAVVHAQAPDHDPPPAASSTAAEGGGFFAVGVQFANLGPLNDRLDEAGYPTFGPEMVSLGGGGYGVKNRVLLGGEGHGLITSDKGHNGRNVSVGGGYGLFKLGYLFRPTSNVRFYPQLGLGGGGLRLEIGDQGNADEFGAILDDPNRSATVDRASLLVSLGVGLEYEFSRPGKKGGFQLGLRAGYVLSPLNSSWELGETSLGAGPDATLQGPFLRLTIGGGGRTYKGDKDDD